MSATKTVFVGLSGGVDSSVTAARLKKQGYNVVGVFIKVWHPDFLVCNWEAERLDAMRVAAHLDIPFFICPIDLSGPSFAKVGIDIFLTIFPFSVTIPILILVPPKSTPTAYLIFIIYSQV